MARYGDASVSSILKSAQAALAARQSFSDAQAAYDFQTSAKTSEDFTKYLNYLQTRAGKESDPMKLLTLTKTVESARKDYRSADILRANTQINYGNMSLYDKRNLLDGQYQEAVANDDMALAQQIENQRSNLDIQIQNQENEAARAASSAASKTTSEYGKAFNKNLGLLQDNESQLKSNLASGKISANSFEAQMAANKAEQLKAFQSLIGPDGNFKSDLGLTNDELESFNKKMADFNTNKDNINFNEQAALRSQNGMSDYGVEYINGVATPVQRAVDQQFTLKDKNGNPILDSGGQPVSGYTYKSGLDGKTYWSGVGTSDGVESGKFAIRQDPNGDKYFVDQKGKTRYIATDKGGSGASNPTVGQVYGEDYAKTHGLDPNRRISLTAKSPEALKALTAPLDANAGKPNWLDYLDPGSAIDSYFGEGSAKKGGDAITGAVNNTPATIAASTARTGLFGAGVGLAGNIAGLVSSLTNRDAYVRDKQAKAAALQKQATEAADANRKAQMVVAARAAAPAPAKVGAPVVKAPTPVFAAPTTTAQRQVNTTQAINNAVGGLYKNLTPTAAPVKTSKPWWQIW